MKPNPYASTKSESGEPKRIGILFWLAFAFSFLICTAPTAVAVYAWRTHWHWQSTGAYERNSFPMNKFASDATWVACACVAITGTCWGLWVMNRRR